MGYQFGFIGTGNMGGALATAVCKQAGPKEVLLSDKTASKAEALAEKLECTADDGSAVFRHQAGFAKKNGPFSACDHGGRAFDGYHIRFLRRGSSGHSDHAEYAGCRRRGHDFVYGKSPCVGS